TADFTAASAIGSAPFEANFTDLSSESPTAWAWSFGDGNASTDQNPMHTYTADGTYTVSLTARSASGADTVVRTDYISVPEPSAVPQLVFAGLGLWALKLRRQKYAFR
ncbi:MAG: PKD domain-containing protein, partial [Deltaproteobacteria bacterium]|nr:PKD domain-containing protein [Deltaproteobacteria bacterium]